MVDIRPILRRLGFALLVFGAACITLRVLLAFPARADDLLDGQSRLVMVDDVGCIYCAKWDRDVRQGYEASPEGHFAPLTRMRIGSPSLSGFGRLVYTPTFILIVRGAEAGRIIGYSSPDFFWGELDRLLAKAGFRPDDVPLKPVEDRAAISVVVPVGFARR